MQVIVEGHLEELEDALDLEKAKAAAKQFISIEDLKAGLKAS